MNSRGMYSTATKWATHIRGGGVVNLVNPDSLAAWHDRQMQYGMWANQTCDVNVFELSI